MPDWDVVVQVLSVLIGGGGGAWAVGAVRDRRRIQAETAKAQAEGRGQEVATVDMIDQMGARWLKRYEERYKEDQDTITELKEGRDRDEISIKRLESDLRIQANYNRDHREWDALAVRKFHELGVEMPAPPPPPPLHSWEEPNQSGI